MDPADDRETPLLYSAAAKEPLGTAIHRATWTARHCQVPVLLVFSGEVLCIEPNHTEHDALEAWARSRHMARHERDA